MGHVVRKGARRNWISRNWSCKSARLHRTGKTSARSALGRVCMYASACTSVCRNYSHVTAHWNLRARINAEDVAPQRTPFFSLSLSLSLSRFFSISFAFACQSLRRVVYFSNNFLFFLFFFLLVPILWREDFRIVFNRCSKWTGRYDRQRTTRNWRVEITERIWYAANRLEIYLLGDLYARRRDISGNYAWGQPCRLENNNCENAAKRRRIGENRRDFPLSRVTLMSRPVT